VSTDGANYVASILSGITPEEIVLRMAQAFLRDELHTRVDTSQLAIVREDADAYYVRPADCEKSGPIAVELRVVKDGSIVERV
jgi:hypothetical protein